MNIQQTVGKGLKNTYSSVSLTGDNLLYRTLNCLSEPLASLFIMAAYLNLARVVRISGLVPKYFQPCSHTAFTQL